MVSERELEDHAREAFFDLGAYESTARAIRKTLSLSDIPAPRKLFLVAEHLDSCDRVLARNPYRKDRTDGQ